MSKEWTSINRESIKTTTTVINANDMEYIRDKYPGHNDQERIANLIDHHIKLERAELSKPAEITAKILRNMGADKKLIDKLLEPI
jgi:hypothetical protein